MKKKTVVRYTQEFRKRAVEQMETSRSITALAQELGVPRERLYRWRQALDPNRSQKPGPRDQENSPCNSSCTSDSWSQKIVEVDFLQGALQRTEQQRSPGRFESGKRGGHVFSLK